MSLKEAIAKVCKEHRKQKGVTRLFMYQNKVHQAAVNGIEQKMYLGRIPGYQVDTLERYLKVSGLSEDEFINRVKKEL